MCDLCVQMCKYIFMVIVVSVYIVYLLKSCPVQGMPPSQPPPPVQPATIPPPVQPAIIPPPQSGPPGRPPPPQGGIHAVTQQVGQMSIQQQQQYKVRCENFITNYRFKWEIFEALHIGHIII